MTFFVAVSADSAGAGPWLACRFRSVLAQQFAACAGAVGVPGQGEHFGVMDEAVDHRRGDEVIGERLAPPSERQVAGDHDRADLTAGGDHLEEQVRRVLIDGM